MLGETLPNRGFTRSQISQLRSGEGVVYRIFLGDIDGDRIAEPLFVGWVPFVVEGEARCAVGLEINGRAMVTNMLEDTRTLLMSSVLVFVVLFGGILLIYIHVIILRPLRLISKGMDDYAQTKDSAAAGETLATVKAANELGTLAEHVSGLTVEIDRYVDEVGRLNREQERSHTELELAAKIQADVLPDCEALQAGHPEFALCGSMTPAKEVGGDFYDCFFLDGTHLALVIGDVSGKGVPAALFMMMTRIIVRNLVRAGMPPAKALTEANAQLCENGQDDMFVTVWLGILDLDTGTVVAANAGHERPILCAAGGAFERVDVPTGFVLGGIEGIRYQSFTLRMEPGAALFLYTDGLPEAEAVGGERFGMARTLQTLNEHGAGSPRELLDGADEAVRRFSDGAPQFDDLTMLCVRYLGRG